MSNHQLIQGSVFGTLLIVAVGCGSSANAGASGAAGAEAAGGESAGGNTTSAGGGVGATAGEATGSSTGGALPAGGIASTLGGNQSTGGTSATGGSATVEWVVATLGKQCPTPGALACSDKDENAVIACDSNGNWVAKSRCTKTGEVCDPSPGATAGSCQRDANCTPNAIRCNNGDDLYLCDPWGTSESLVADCPLGCIGTSCSLITGCASFNFIQCDCTGNCIYPVKDACSCGADRYGFPGAGYRPDVTSGNVLFHFDGNFATNLSKLCGTTTTRRAVDLGPKGVEIGQVLRVTSLSPWYVKDFVAASMSDVCSLTDHKSCIVITNPVDPASFWAYTDDPNAGETNVKAEYLPTGATCP